MLHARSAASPFPRNLLRRSFLVLAGAVALVTPGIAGAQVSSNAPSTQPVAGVTHHIALVSDPHVTSTPGKYTRNFIHAIEAVNASDAEVVLMPGDLTQGGSEKDYAAFKDLVGQFSVKAYFVPGNHDTGNKLTKKVYANTPQPVSAEKLDRYKASLGEFYFSHEVVKGVRVIGICSSLLGSGLEQEAAQWTFLEREMKTHFDGVTLLLMHYPPFLKQANEGDEYFNTNADQRARLLELMKAGNVKTVLSGHLHYPLEWEVDGVKLISAPAVSFGLPQNVQREGWMLVTIAPDGSCTAETRFIPREPSTQAATQATTQPTTQP